jgi:TatD DNase family protein
MHFIETHAHLDSPRFEDDREQVIERALDAGIAQIVTVGADLASSRAAISLAERYDCIYTTIGVHPHDAEAVDVDVMRELAVLSLHPRVVAIGEIGLDFYRNYAPRDRQVDAFATQLQLASEVGKPIVVHVRDLQGSAAAYDMALNMLEKWRTVRIQSGNAKRTQSLGVLHCYSGDLAHAQKAIDLGFYLGIDGPVTYPNADDLRQVLGQVSLESLLLETDCPYLAPQTRRGRRNEPAYIPYIAQALARLYQVPLSTIAQRTTANAEQLFGLSVR